MPTYLWWRLRVSIYWNCFYDFIQEVFHFRLCLWRKKRKLSGLNKQNKKRTGPNDIDLKQHESLFSLFKGKIEQKCAFVLQLSTFSLMIFVHRIIFEQSQQNIEENFLWAIEHRTSKLFRPFLFLSCPDQRIKLQLLRTKFRLMMSYTFYPITMLS